jgi:hypothetical protein
MSTIPARSRRRRARPCSACASWTGPRGSHPARTFPGPRSKRGVPPASARKTCGNQKGGVRPPGSLCRGPHVSNVQRCGISSQGFSREGRAPSPYVQLYQPLGLGNNPSPPARKVYVAVGAVSDTPSWARVIQRNSALSHLLCFQNSKPCDLSISSPQAFPSLFGDPHNPSSFVRPTSSASSPSCGSWSI